MGVIPLRLLILYPHFRATYPPSNIGLKPPITDKGVGVGYLLVEDGLSLATITGLFAVITALSLSSNAILTLLVLGHLVQRVLPALLALAICLLCLRNVHLPKKKEKRGSIEHRFLNFQFLLT